MLSRPFVSSLRKRERKEKSDSQVVIVGMYAHICPLIIHAENNEEKSWLSVHVLYKCIYNDR